MNAARIIDADRLRVSVAVSTDADVSHVMRMLVYVSVDGKIQKR